jgi:hypothetical protein
MSHEENTLEKATVMNSWRWLIYFNFGYVYDRSTISDF